MSGIVTQAGMFGGKSGGGVAPFDPDFVLRVDTTKAGSASDMMIIPTLNPGGGLQYDCMVDWGDGHVSGPHTGNAPTISRTYAVGGIYDIRIVGDFPRIYFNNTGDRLKLLQVLNWGNALEGMNQERAFRGCANLSTIAVGGLWFETVLVALSVFRDCGSFVIPEGVRFDSVTGTGSMFQNTNVGALPMSLRGNSIINGTDMFRSSGVTDLGGLELANLFTATDMFRDGNFITDLPPAMKLSALNNGTRMLQGNTINTTRYSQLLIDMNALNPNNSVPFHGGNSKYNAAGQTARNALIARGWTFTDGGLE